MKAILISKENNEAKFTIEFNAEEFDAEVVKVYQAQKGQFEIDGFRKGKAPRSIIEKKYGENIFIEDAVNQLFGNAYPEALTELELETVAQPAVTFDNIEKGKDFKTTVTVGIYPELTIEGYTGVEVEKIETEVTEEDIQNELEAMQKKNARMVDSDGPVKDGDTVVLDYSGSVDGKLFDGGTADGFSLKIGSGQFIPGFEDQLIGAEKEVETEVKVTFPAEYQAEELAGKEAIFVCTVHEIKKEELPEIDDDFVVDVSDFDTVDELKAEIKKATIETKKLNDENQMKDKVIEKIYEGNEIEIPEGMIEDEIDSIMKELDGQLRQQGLELQKYFELTGTKEDDFRNEAKQDAEKRVKTRMILRGISEQEKITASEEEVNEEIKMMAAQYGLPEDQLKGMLGEEYMNMIAKDIQMRRAVDYVFEKAVIK